MLKDLFEKYDSVKFVVNDQTFRGWVSTVSEDYSTVNARPIDIYEQSLGVVCKYNIYPGIFKKLKVEWLDEHRGADNSAIGVAPSWTDMSYVSKEAV